MLQTFSGDLPAHVPKELVMSFPLRLGAETWDNPFTTLIPEMHKAPRAYYAPDAWSGVAPAWVFRRADDLTEIYLDTDNFSSKDFAPFATLMGENWGVFPVEADLPMHTHYRALMQPLFTPKRVAEMNDRVRYHARYYIDQFKDGHGCEFVSAFAARFPIAVFLELFGLPIDEVEQFLAWEDDLLHNPDISSIAAATAAVKNYIMTTVDNRRKEPKDDLISALTHSTVDGRPATDDEIFGLCFNLYLGGLDTLTTNLGWQFRHLATHPEHQQYLRDNPDQIPDAVEELLRAYSAVATGRTCIKPVKIGGVQLMPGDRVVMSTTLGSTDPEVFDNPTEVRFDRKPRHLAFGSGIHNCVGLRLARRELHVAMEELLKALPPFRLAPDAKILTRLGGVIAMDSLPLVW
ncbi:MAG: cytochrome P450 [Gammaproteobacteria bacterium BRH_c0]|nr:MAG: cytochrome P450 [Gammaproteobacteria bacterium BRH_c0]